MMKIIFRSVIAALLPILASCTFQPSPREQIAGSWDCDGSVVTFTTEGLYSVSSTFSKFTQDGTFSLKETAARGPWSIIIEDAPHPLRQYSELRDLPMPPGWGPKSQLVLWTPIGHEPKTCDRFDSSK